MVTPESKIIIKVTYCTKLTHTFTIKNLRTESTDAITISEK